jgi:hypothetical protein
MTFSLEQVASATNVTRVWIKEKKLKAHRVWTFVVEARDLRDFLRSRLTA